MIYGESGYMKRNGLEDSGGVEDGPKYKEEDWRKSDLRGVRIYEEEWTGWTGWSRYMNSDLRGVRIYEEEWTGWSGMSKI